MKQKTALSILQSGVNVFLTGEPGSGKTHTINEYVSYLCARGVEPAITASTGIAATHISGFTIHSWCGIGVRQNLTVYDLDTITQNRRIAGRVGKAHVLIIDEVSMLSDKTLAMADRVCRKIRRSDLPFGGMQVVLVGDFFQLPPVVTRASGRELALFTEPAAPQFAYASSVWRELKPLTCYLTEQHRQEDAAFLELLSAIRRGAFLERHRALLRTRYAPLPRGVTSQLYSHNADVDRINAAELAKLSGTERVFSMESHGPKQMVTGLKRGCLSPEQLMLKINARVMFTKNDLVKRAYANGTLGIVTGFSKDGGFPVIKTNAGTLVTAEPVEWNVGERGRVLAHISQVPLRLAWAITIHKSQGMSLDAAHMNLAAAFEYGQGYVALSRVRTLAGLTLAGLNDRAVLVHPDVQRSDAEFYAASRAVEDLYTAMPAAELAGMQKNFIRACGGRAGHTKQADRTYSVERVWQKHAHAYRPWSADDDAHLLQLYRTGMSAAALAEKFKRNRGAIISRLRKLV